MQTKINLDNQVLHVKDYPDSGSRFLIMHFIIPSYSVYLSFHFKHGHNSAFISLCLPNARIFFCIILPSSNSSVFRVFLKQRRQQAPSTSTTTPVFKYESISGTSRAAPKWNRQRLTYKLWKGWMRWCDWCLKRMNAFCPWLWIGTICQIVCFSRETLE